MAFHFFKKISDLFSQNTNSAVSGRVAKFPLTFHNTLTKKDEVFVPLKDRTVTMYNCGPTVYDYAHIGNLRAYVFADTIKRALLANNYSVKQVINITDVGELSTGASGEGEDKMIEGLKREGMPITVQAMRQLADKYTDAYKQNLSDLGIDISTITFPRASDFIPQQIDLIKALERAKLTYKTSDGVYFDTQRFPSYGKLGDFANMQADDALARVASSREKKSFRDFALWKLSGEMGWQSPWGQGFPGWHIECSAMSMSLLGETIDIHTGGIDHIPTHHNNEIAQSEGASGKQFVRYWMHGAFLTMGAEKISKSLGNTLYLHTLAEKGITPRAYRYWLLTAHYNTQATFSWDALIAAQNAYVRIIRTLEELGQKAGNSRIHGSILPDRRQQFMNFINNDLDTPAAIANIWKLLDDETVLPEDKIALIYSFDEVLGLDLEHGVTLLEQKRSTALPAAVTKLVQERNSARLARDWKRSDELRTEINKLGYDIKDAANGTEVTKN